MDELSEYSSEILEFLPTQQLGKQCKVVEACVSTDMEASCQDKSVETTLHSHTSTQTELSTSMDRHLDDQKLATWLRKIYPAVEAQLLKGTTPLNDNDEGVQNAITSFSENLNIQLYQKITFGGAENSQGIATWLSVHTNNAPMLVVSTKSPHDNWCDHLQQTLKLFVPKRIQTGNLVAYAECKSVPLKACLGSMSTNTYNKSIFAGSTLDGDIHVWGCRSNNRVGNNNTWNGGNSVSSYEIDELCCASSLHGSAVVLCWSSENRLLSFHSNGFIISWAVGKELLMENDFQLKVQPSEITAAVSLSSNTFVVGVKDGSIYLCTITSFSTMRKQMEIVPLKKHSFMISTLIKTVINGCQTVISCDLSGQVVYHSIPHIEEENQEVTRIPLPFKTTIACSKDGHVIYSPGSDGSLECYNIVSGVHTVVEGALRGKGNFIACSDNGNWIITGLYADDFQIFYIEN
ncbi:uncharacterized protein LOC105211001 [Zeugodacus cucurbitae]|uniref:Cytoplasmic dynein 1 intermediate chain 2 n=1 Tax=Zeugodacus cucurbitae TaxID=28588 RepID=A0A0A1X7J9_ZEUCU|nr:uncharacterized protein LOC105211001 [Zeugodacus cucurbitae]